jgi:hypothetical protein
MARPLHNSGSRGMTMMPLCEEQIEAAFEVFYKKLFSEDRDLAVRQYPFLLKILE